MVSIYKKLIKIDQVFDFIPYVSTATNALTLIFKATVAAGCVPKAIRQNKFAKHLCNKSNLRCVTLLVPRYGNVAFAVYKLFRLALSKCAECLESSSVNQPVKPTPQQQEQLAKLHRTNAEIETSFQKLQQSQKELQNLLDPSSKDLNQMFVENFKKGKISTIQSRLLSLEKRIPQNLKMIQKRSELWKSKPVEVDFICSLIPTHIEHFKVQLDFGDLIYPDTDPITAEKVKQEILADTRICQLKEKVVHLLESYIDLSQAITGELVNAGEAEKAMAASQSFADLIALKNLILL